MRRSGLQGGRNFCAPQPLPSHASACNGRLSKLLTAGFWFPFWESSGRFLEWGDFCSGFTANLVLAFDYPPLAEPTDHRFDHMSDNRPASVTLPANSYTLRVLIIENDRSVAD